MEETKVSEDNDTFNVGLIGIVFDPAKRQILIAREEPNPELNKTLWRLPGGKAISKEDMETSLKKAIKEKTGYVVESLGSVFSRILPERNDIILIYHLCEIKGGKEKLGGNFTELKWINPEELKNYLTTKFPADLEEYINNLK
jgi:ADP-ribose pyrophosphatase YjhB (NUDIX family)